jgi:transposase
MKRYIGVDLHKNNFVVCYLGKDGKQKLQSFKIDCGGIESFKKTLGKGDEVAVEASGNTAYFAREIEGKVKAVRIINPAQFKIISRSVKKTDEQDAVTIARYLSKELIPEVRMRSKEESQVGSLIGTRDKFVKLRSALKNKLHNILNANGIVTKREIFGTNKGLDKVLETKIDPAYMFEIRIIVDQIRNFNKVIEEIGKELTDRGEKINGHKNLTSITGIGNISATILLNAIGDVNYFENDKKLSAYFGIVPRVAISNTTQHYGKITKMGNKIARTALVQSTLIAIRYNEYLKSFYTKLKAKKGSGKAIIATARKLLTIIYRTLKNNWVFEDFNKNKLLVSH